MVCQLAKIDVEAALDVLLPIYVAVQVSRLTAILLERQLRELAQLAVCDFVSTLALVAAVDFLAEITEVSELGLVVPLLDRGTVDLRFLLLQLYVGNTKEVARLLFRIGISKTIFDQILDIFLRVPDACLIWRLFSFFE